MRRILLAITVVLALVGGRHASAEDLAYSLFERYLDSLREQAGIPGLSAAIVQNKQIAWSRGLGRENIESSVAASPRTPYPIGDLSQALGATVLLKKCVDESYLEVRDLVIRWVPEYADHSATVAQLLTHAGNDGIFRYDPTRFAAISDVVRQCASQPYPKLLAHDVFDRLAMFDSVPGATLATPDVQARAMFTAAELGRYGAVLKRMALPYKVDTKGRATRSEYAPRPLDAAQGVVTTVLDLANFDAALNSGVLLDRATLTAAWTRASSSGGALPTGLGWFVQYYNGELLVWQFGTIRDSYSSLMLKLPNRDLTLILLANSDGLNSAVALERGDVTASAFARTLLRLLNI